MGLHLSTSRLQDLEKLLDVLSAPLDYGGEKAWLDAVNGGVGALFDADGTMSLLPGPGEEIVTRFHDADPEVAEVVADAVSGAGRGQLHFRYPGLERLMRRLAAARVQVWTTELAERLTGIRLADLDYTREVALPTGTYHQANMAIPLPTGLALVAFYHHAPDRDPLGDDRIDLLRLLLPAFRSGVGALEGLRRSRDALVDQLDSDPRPSLVFRPNGGELYRNPAAEDLLSEDHRAPLRDEVRRLAARLTALRRTRRKSDPGPPALVDEQEVEIGADRFRLSATFLPPGVVDRGWTALVRIQPRQAPLPSPEVIERRLGLTPRQAEVALHIARGRTSAEIADLLGISVHTVRRHTEAILSRLDVPSRAAVGTRILGSTSSR